MLGLFFEIKLKMNVMINQISDSKLSICLQKYIKSSTLKVAKLLLIKPLKR